MLSSVSGKVTRVTDALNQQTNFAYDQIGNMTRMTDARINDTYFAYEFGAGCGCGGSGSAVTRITYPNNDYETFAYDANGNLTLKTDCNGAQIQYAYDALNHITQKTYPGSSTATFAYDKIGNPARRGTFGHATLVI
ncbi:hypothetical protein HZA56_14875 [Candidatus Poribacteria bacterium]|nr:hypothetical protein [Candidatus Poribacteria bacterium]